MADTPAWPLSPCCSAAAASTAPAIAVSSAALCQESPDPLTGKGYTCIRSKLLMLQTKTSGARSIVTADNSLVCLAVCRHLPMLMPLEPWLRLQASCCQVAAEGSRRP
jgi:hypothetical protein